MRSRMQWVCALVVIGFTFPAAAQEAGGTRSGGGQRFGREGQLVLSADLGLPFIGLRTEVSELTTAVGYSTVEDIDTGFIYFAPAADYFIAPNISVGGMLSLGAEFSEGDDLTLVGFGGRVGINLPLEGRLSFWPRFTASINFFSVDTDFGDSTATFGKLDFFGPFLFHPGSNFFLGLGPALTFNVGDASGVTFGARSMIGGYF